MLFVFTRFAVSLSSLSSTGNFKTEKGAPQWNYILGVKEGWIPKDLDNRNIKC
jgi:hypothetical protein